MYCIVCSYAGPIKVKVKNKTPLHNKHGERSYSSKNQYFEITGLVRPGYHDNIFGVPSEGTLLNVYKKKKALNTLFQFLSHYEYYE